MTLKFQLSTLLFVLLSATTIFSQTNIVLKTDFDGKIISGSKQTLIDEIRKGKSVRIGWQMDIDEDKKADFDHWAPAEFITILNGEVFTQIRSIYIQSPNIDIPQVQIFPSSTMWTAILGTNGLLKNRFVYDDKLESIVELDGSELSPERLEKEIKKRSVQTWNVATIWVVED